MKKERRELKKERVCMYVCNVCNVCMDVVWRCGYVRVDGACIVRGSNTEGVRGQLGWFSRWWPCVRI